MTLLTCDVRIASKLPLQQVGAVLSERVFGGIPMGGLTEYIRDEVPAIYTTSRYLGTRFILMGEPDEEGYFLQAETLGVLTKEFTPEQLQESLVDVSEVIVTLLSRADGVAARAGNWAS